MQWERGKAFEQAQAERLHPLADSGWTGRNWDESAGRTLVLMREGHSWIYHAVLALGVWRGVPDLLRRVSGSSELGAYTYEPVDIKEHREVTLKDRVQLLAYAALLQPVLGRRPARGWVWLKRQEDTLDEEIKAVDLVSEQRDFEQLQDEMLAIRNGAFPTSPLRCSECAQCPWRADCRNRWEREDSVCLLYGVSGQTARRLLDAGLCTIRDLLATEVDDVAQRLAWRLEDAKVLRIRAQARRENRPIVIRSPTFPEGRPVIYYDIETFGDLTYLHGLLVRVNGAAQERSCQASSVADP